MTADPAGVFASDAHRRVLGNLDGTPRSLEQLGDFLRRNDPNVPLGNDELDEVIQDLQAEGHVASIGEHDSVEAIVSAVGKAKGVSALPADTAEALERNGGRQPRLYIAGERFIATDAGVEKLQEDPPNAPPALEGDQLARAEAERDQFFAAERERADAERKRGIESARAALREVEKGKPELDPEGGEE